jgi:hypothetical protein
VRTARLIVLALMATTLSAASGIAIANELGEGLQPDALATISGVLGLVGWIALIVLADRPTTGRLRRRSKR